jgi:hypothetical protein
MTKTPSTGVRATCSNCGDIGLFVSEITVSRDDAMRHMYRFRCPICSLSTVKDADLDVAMLLVRAGAPIEDGRLPRERDDQRVADMTDNTFYILCNDTTGSDSKHETLEAALDAVNEKIGPCDEWFVHELTRGSIAHWITGGNGHNDRPTAASPLSGYATA